MTRDELVRFLRRYKLALEASVTPGGAPQAAVVGFAVSDELEIVFDTVESTRKYKNLRADPRDRPRDRLGRRDHRAARRHRGLPAGRRARAHARVLLRCLPGRSRSARMSGHHVRVRPHWVRYSDFTQDPAPIVELASDQLG
jgi:hypothetical protein